MKRTNRLRRILKTLFLLFLTAVLGVGAVNLHICYAVHDRIVPPESAYYTDADCILILGAGVRADGSPSHMLEDRLLTGIGLCRNGMMRPLLMSGDHGSKEYDEVNCMKNYAAAAGIPEEKIFMDHAGFSTYESLYRAKDVFGAEKIVIVTQEYHLYRALYVAEALGLDAVGVSADLRTYYGQSMRETRELAARVKDWLYTILKPLPTYLGDPIDLTGDGRVTNG
ncbi:MAG: YdcF family protein [Clostridia bacterium]|nr:YdcF family protein [Clostridia bacterium]